MRITDREMIKNWRKNQGIATNKVDAKVLKEVLISAQTWKNILYLKGYCPNPQTMKLLAQHTGLDENALFPTQEGDKAA